MKPKFNSPRVTDGDKFTKIMDDRKPSFEELCDPAYRRRELISVKSGAVWTAFLELNGLINKTRLSEQYFQRTQAWFSQKLNGCTLHRRKQSFTEEEYKQLADSFRDIARRLMIHADEIDSAAPDYSED